MHLTTCRNMDDPDGGDEFRDAADPEPFLRNTINAVRDAISDRIAGRLTADECLLRIVDLVYGPGATPHHRPQPGGSRRQGERA